MSAPPANPRRRRLEAEARQLLAQASVIAEAGAGQLNPNGPIHYGKSDDNDGSPAGNRNDTYSQFAHRFAGCKTERDLNQAVDEARKELQAIKQYTAPKSLKLETVKEHAARMVREGDGFDARTVAIQFKVTQQVVVRARLDAGREPTYGRPLPTGKLPADRRRLEVRARSAEGQTLRQIAFALGVGKSTIERDLAA